MDGGTHGWIAAEHQGLQVVAARHPEAETRMAAMHNVSVDSTG